MKNIIKSLMTNEGVLPFTDSSKNENDMTTIMANERCFMDEAVYRLAI